MGRFGVLLPCESRADCSKSDQDKGIRIFRQSSSNVHCVSRFSGLLQLDDGTREV
jgi:hypothetical protein